MFTVAPQKEGKRRRRRLDTLEFVSRSLARRDTVSGRQKCEEELTNRIGEMQAAVRLNANAMVKGFKGSQM